MILRNDAARVTWAIAAALLGLAVLASVTVVAGLAPTGTIGLLALAFLWIAAVDAARRAARRPLPRFEVLPDGTGLLERRLPFRRETEPLARGDVADLVRQASEDDDGDPVFRRVPVLRGGRSIPLAVAHRRGMLEPDTRRLRAALRLG